MSSLEARVRSGQIDIPPLVSSASDNGLERSNMSQFSSVILVAGLASLTETDWVFLPGEPVKPSLDLIERTPYAKVSSRYSFVTGAEHILN